MANTKGLYLGVILMERNKINSKKRIATIVMIVLFLVSLLVFRPILSSVDTWKGEMQTLDAKRNTVLQLLGASSAASAVITLIPDDVGTPIADQLADLSVVFLAVLAMLMAEKYLLPLMGGFTTTLLIPAICALYILYIWRGNKRLMSIIIKLVVLAVALLTLIPASVMVSNTIDRTFEATINETVNTALESNQELDIGDAGNQNIWQKITGAVSDAIDYAGKAIDIAKKTLGNFVEAAAVMLVTSCVIPIVVLIAYIMIVRYIFGLNINILGLSEKVLPSQRHRHIEGEKKLME